MKTTYSVATRFLPSILQSFLTLVVTTFFMACGSTPSLPPSSPTLASRANQALSTEIEANLLHEEAALRAQAISNVSYELSVNLDKKSDRFMGNAKVRFHWRVNLQGGIQQTPFLDFKDSARISSFIVNGTPVVPRFSRHRLYLPVESLLVAPLENSIEITYDQLYARDGHGLHRFKDPEDGNVYLYTHFEAFYAHHVFPCFDQPDLKAKMKLEVVAPTNWTVVSTTREKLRVTSGEKSTWSFPETPSLSTYLFSLHAGPFHQWESKGGPTPLRLFARQSLKTFVHPQDWFKPTSQGLRFFSDYFGLGYPFGKYDQVIVPEFNAGAMENVAAVTFSERYLSRGVTTREEREDIAEVILHELAHQWFGNLVTMRWWNGLWLNESFATYMSHLAKVRATEFKDSWQGFSLYQKARALLEDQLDTTHPIESQVPDTDSAFSNFDAITYGKGAASLKQLAFFIGDEKFRDGLRLYFKKHRFGNTSIEDFTEALETSARIDLSNWTKTWLNTSGVDTLKTEFKCEKGRISHFSLMATTPTIHRPHRTQIALYKEEMGYLLPYKIIKTNYEGEKTIVAQLKGAPCPALVLPNDQDQDYIKVRLDTQSLQMALTKLPGIQSPFTRATVWSILFEAVRDLPTSHLKPQEFLRAALLNIATETDTKNIESIVRSASKVFLYLPQTTAEEKTQRQGWVENFESALWSRLLRGNATKDLQLVLLDSYINVSESAGAEKKLLELLSRRALPSGLSIDQDRRWEMIVRLNSLASISLASSEELIATESKTDNSERAIKMALAAQAAQPKVENKRTWIQRVIEMEELSYSQKREVFRHILPPSQDHLRPALTGEFYERLPVLAKTKTLNLVVLYARTLFPATCSPDLATKFEPWLIDLQGGVNQLPSPALKSVKNAFQENQICLRARKNALAP
jgi:aminopeptidase N